jgi:hypothetical protein
MRRQQHEIARREEAEKQLAATAATKRQAALKALVEKQKEVGPSLHAKYCHALVQLTAEGHWQCTAADFAPERSLCAYVSP